MTDQLEPQKNLNKMGTMPIGRLMVSMSVPAMFSMIVQALYNIVDSYFVSQLGQDGLTAVTLVFPVQMLLVAVGVGTGVGLNSLISRRLGEQRIEEANSTATHGILLGVISGIIFAFFGIFLSGMFIRAFGAKGDVLRYGVDYCTIVCTFAVFMFVQVYTEKIIQATGNMILPMISTLIGAVTNIILDPILIFGLFGAPRLEVAGAAVATIIGQALAMCVILTAAFVMKHDVHIHFKGFRFQGSIVRNIYAVGFPAIVMQSIGSVMLVGLNAILISFSDAAVAVLGVYFRLQSFIFMPVFGLNQGAMPIIGYNYGARNKERLMHAFKLALIAAVVIMTIGVIIFQIFPKEMMLIFNASDEMLGIGIRALRMISLCFIPAAVGIMASTLFQAIGHGTLSLMVSLMRQLIMILPIAFLISRLWGLDYVWLAFPLAEAFALVASLILLRRLYNREIKPLTLPDVSTE